MKIEFRDKEKVLLFFTYVGIIIFGIAVFILLNNKYIIENFDKNNIEKKFEYDNSGDSSQNIFTINFDNIFTKKREIVEELQINVYFDENKIDIKNLEDKDDQYYWPDFIRLSNDNKSLTGYDYYSFVNRKEGYINFLVLNNTKNANSSLLLNGKYVLNFDNSFNNNDNINLNIGSYIKDIKIAKLKTNKKTYIDRYDSYKTNNFIYNNYKFD